MMAARSSGRRLSKAARSMFAFMVLGTLSLPAYTADDKPVFTDVTAQAGIDFIHFNGMSGELYFAEMVGHGGALFDYDNDGDLDAFIVQGNMLGADKQLSDALFPPASPKLTDRLYRNDLIQGDNNTGTLHFSDITDSAGIKGLEYGMGATTGDFDNDGYVDLYVTNFGLNRLWRNNGDGTFSDVTVSSGTGDPSWSVSATFVDFDRDGWLDLYVVNYVEYSVDNNPRCYARSSRLDYCGPKTFKPAHDRLYRNLGNGRFEDVTAKTLQDYKPAAGLGVGTGDFNGDGLVDIYVANDAYPNHLWFGQKNKTLRDDGMFSGVAVNRAGKPEASMGIDANDFDNDGDLDLFMTHLTGETNTLYLNQGGGVFDDRTNEFGLAAPSSPYTGFGTAWFDYDNDGWLDLLVLNGAVRQLEAALLKGDPYPLKEPNQLFRNMSGRGFTNTTATAGPALTIPEVSRGAAFGDVDNDGDTDVMIFNNSGRTRLLLNNLGNSRPWLGIRLVDPASKRDAQGARIEVLRDNGHPIWRHARVDGSYCTANDPRLLVGLGDNNKVKSVRIYWPDGTTESWLQPPTGQYTTLYKGDLNN